MQTPLEHGKSAAVNFDPANYVYVTSGYNWNCGEDYAEYVNACLPDYTEDESNAIWQAYIQEDPSSGLRAKGHGGKCQHCGQHLHWFVLFRDVRTGKLLITGTKCAEELDLPDKGSLIRKALGERIETARKLDKIDKAHPGLRQEIGRVVCEGNRAYFQTFLGDICLKINRYHELSDKQADTCKRLLKKGLDTIAQRAAEAANRKSAPAPEGRVVVTGKVLTVKEYEVEDHFGSRYSGGFKTVYKILVEDDSGFRCFGSLPSNFGNDIRGWRVTFRATLSPKAEDPTFAFFKRPSNAKELADATGAAIPEPEPLLDQWGKPLPIS